MSANNMVNESEISEAGMLNRISMESWITRVQSFLKYGVPSQKALVCEGEAGCGKSEITVQACRDMGLEPIICPGIGAQQMEEFLALTRLDKDDSGHGIILQAYQDNIMPSHRHVESGKYVLDIGGVKKIVIPWIIDEIFSGTMGQANQLRSALTFRQIGSVVLPQGTYNGMEVGVYILGTTNPEDVIYSSRKSMDAAVMDRIATYRVYMDFEYHQAYLAKLADVNRYPEICRLFLRMDEQRDLWKLASPRFWTQSFGQTWMELDSDRSIDSDSKLRLFCCELEDHFQKVALNEKSRGIQREQPMTAKSLVTRFEGFIEHGDDPHFYPISANAVLRLADDPKVVKQHNYLFEYWNKNNQHNFIGVTIQDLMTVVANVEEVTESQARHISGLLNKSGVGLATQFCRTVFSKSKHRGGSNAAFEMVMEAVTGTPVYGEVAKAMAKHDQMTREINEAKRNKLRKKMEDD